MKYKAIVRSGCINRFSWHLHRCSLNHVLLFELSLLETFYQYFVKELIYRMIWLDIFDSVSG